MFAFCCRKRKKANKKLIAEMFGFGFLVQKWRFCDAQPFFKKWVAETPIFIVFLWCAFWAKWSKKGKFGPSPKKRKWTDN